MRPFLCEFALPRDLCRMTAPSINLSGAWTGVYDYDDPSREPVGFTATLTDIGGVLWGAVSERNSFALIEATELAASVSGMRSLREVTFTKEYQGDVPGGEETIFYVGRLTENGKRIEGEWHIKIPFQTTGPFVMNRLPTAEVDQSVSDEASVSR